MGIDRRELAERVATAYAGIPGVRAVLLTGSVARDFDDGWSDVELMVFHDGEPSEEARRAVPGLVTCWEYDGDNDEWADDLLIDGVEVQASHKTVAGAEAWLSACTVGHDPDLVKQDFIALVRYGVPLHGSDVIAAWRRATDLYPDELRLAMVTEHLDFRSDWHRRKLLDRGELLPLYTDLVDSVRNVHLVLLGLNGVWFPHLGFKWLRRTAADLVIAPPDLADRLDAVLTAEPA
ncbi:MAG TPA: hypothetical protein VGJ28_15095, partial [Micromonosporaceae bacterium]